MLKKSLVLAYGLSSYSIFFVVFSYSILFIGNIFVTPSLDSPGQGNLMDALLINASLLALFALQHSIMARPSFKQAIAGFIPPHVERSTYVLASTILLAAIVYYWQPMGGVIWQLTDPTAIAIVYGIFAIGWGILFLASFQLNHFDLFGLRQVWLYFRGKPYTQLPFSKPWLYRYMRHPLYVGLMIGLWAAPTMTVAHLVFAVLCTAYIFIGAKLEERDLKVTLPEYSNYKEEVSMFLPLPGNKNIQKSSVTIQE